MTEKKKQKYDGRANLKTAPPWKPGQSGNPTGKNNNAKAQETRRRNLSMTRELHQRCEEDNVAQRLVDVAIAKAEEGDFKFVKELWDRVDGAITQEVRFVAELERKVDDYLLVAEQTLPREHYVALVHAWADFEESGACAETNIPRGEGVQRH